MLFSDGDSTENEEDGNGSVRLDSDENGHCEEAKRLRMEKKQNEYHRKLVKSFKTNKNTSKTAKKVLFSDSYSTETDFTESEDDPDTESDEEVEKTANTDILENDFVLVEESGNEKLNAKYSVGLVESKSDEGYNVTYYKKLDNCFKFVKTDKTYFFEANKIFKKLPQPNITGGTERRAAMCIFAFKFDQLHVV